jgi:formamidopyrimidine-DNA glycosylase
MPELPEIETIKNGILDLIGTKISSCVIRFPKLRYLLDQKALQEAVGQRIITISRRAKYLLIHLEQGQLIIHLGMSGRLTLYTDTPPQVSKHDHIDISAGTSVLRYNDPRRFGYIMFNQSHGPNPLLENLGPEPLGEGFTAEYLLNKSLKLKSTVKQIIMNPAIVVGVGNIYACEALFLSKINPQRQGCSLNLTECATLVNQIQLVLQAAIQAGGSTLRDYKTATGDLGYFQFSHKVYGKYSQPCPECSSPITAIRLGQRNSFYCPNCQK